MASDYHGAAAALDQLAARLNELEEGFSQLSRELRTRRLVIAAQDGTERLLAEVVGGVLELHLRVPATPEPSDGLLLFSAEASEDLPAGCGLQIWSGGNVVKEFEWWRDG